MIAVDTTGAIIGEPPPSLEAPPVDMVSSSRPQIITEENKPWYKKMFRPKSAAQWEKEEREAEAIKKGIKNVGIGFLKAVSAPGRYVGNKVFPSYFSENVKIPEYDRPIPENLKDSWITYADIPEEKDITLFDNHPTIKHWTWKALSWFPHRYNVALNSRDYHDYKIRSSKTNPISKVLNVPSYFGNALAAKGLYIGNKIQDLATDPVGTVWNDPVLSKEVKSFVTKKAMTAANELIDKSNLFYPDYNYRNEHGYNLVPSYDAKEFYAWRHSLVEDGIRLILDDDQSTSSIHSTQMWNIQRAAKDLRNNAKKNHWNQKKIEEKAKPLRRLLKASKIVNRFARSYDQEKKRTQKMAEEEREKIMNDNFRDRLEKDDMEKPQGQTALLTAGATGFMGGGGGGGSIWGKWKRGRRQTWFNKYGFRTNRVGKMYHRYKRKHHYSWKWHY